MQLHRLPQVHVHTFGESFSKPSAHEQIEPNQSKHAILVEYLNRAPFGGNLVGAGAASWRCFSSPCRELSLAQAALLAGLPRNPNGDRPDRFPRSPQGPSKCCPRGCATPGHDHL